jgi:hypothetical protein
MGLIGNILSGGLGSVVEKVGDIADKFHLSGEEKNEFKLQLETLLQKRDAEVEETIRTELGAKERVMVAELQSGDNFTRRARPLVVYVGLAAIVFNYCIAPFIQGKPLDLPQEFWISWGGIVATWSIGRSAEKRGTRSKLTSAITGSRLDP